jgi:hypothetical protein
MRFFMHQLAQEIAQVGNPFEKYGERPDNDGILFKRVHHIIVIMNSDEIFEKTLHQDSLIQGRSDRGKTTIIVINFGQPGAYKIARGFQFCSLLCP